MKLVGDIYRLMAFLLRCSQSINRSRVIVISIVLTGIVGGLSVTALITVINSAMNRMGSSSTALIAGFVALIIISPLTRFASQVLLVRLTARAVFELRMQLCRRILSASLSHLEDLGTHRLMATLTEDIPAIIGALTAVPVLCVDAAIVLGCLIYLGWLSWPLLIAVVLLMVFGVATYQVPVLRAVRYFGLAREEADALFRHYRALADGAKELKLHRSRRGAFYSWLEQTTGNLQRYNTLANTLATGAANWGDILYFIFIGFLLFALPSALDAGLETLSGYVLTILFMRGPLAEIMNTIPGLGRATIAVEKVETLGLSLVTHPLEEHGRKTEPEPSWQLLEVSGVTHSYAGDGEERDFVLGPIDLALYPGELLFLVGGNGSGKTTLAKVLTGLYVPDSGEIRVDGEPVTRGNRDDYRQRFSAVFSDFYIFENFLGFEGSATDVKARDYLTRLQLDHKVKVEDSVLSTINLSHGQRKRLALLTAYLEDRPIYLFDEWAADQDPFFKEVFYYELLPELKSRGKTVVVISHDDRYYHVADRIIKLDYGKLEYDSRSDKLQQLESRRIGALPL